MKRELNNPGAAQVPSVSYQPIQSGALLPVVNLYQTVSSWPNVAPGSPLSVVLHLLECGKPLNGAPLKMLELFQLTLVAVHAAVPLLVIYPKSTASQILLGGW